MVAAASTTTTWSCTGSYQGTTQPADGKYDLTAFGCWVDASGVKHGDSGDNCIPGCLAKAKSAGLCSTSDAGKACEERVSWYVADAGRFGCLQRVKIVNPSNGRAVVAVALDYGPACWVEAKVHKAALDASGHIANRYLFGADQGVTDKANHRRHLGAVDDAARPVDTLTIAHSTPVTNCIARYGQLVIGVPLRHDQVELVQRASPGGCTRRTAARRRCRSRAPRAALDRLVVLRGEQVRGRAVEDLDRDVVVAGVEPREHPLALDPAQAQLAELAVEHGGRRVAPRPRAVLAALRR